LQIGQELRDGHFAAHVLRLSVESDLHFDLP
jgi:hypothetical protein